MDAYCRRTGEHMTYERLAAATGLSRATLASLASRDGYDTRLSTVAKLCRALDCQLDDILELIAEPKKVGVKHEN